MSDAEAKALQRALEGRFEVLEVLGRGAMGAVFRGRDPALNREVAIKTIQVGHDRLRLERFKREAELTAALEHPGIVRVHSAGVAGGVPYLVTELVPGGKTLDDVLPGLTLRQRVALIRDVASALGYAHAQGVVHRDVKPSNVLIDAKGRIRVADFGLAAAEGLEKLTRTGAAVGTPAYMPPEQVRGKRAEIGPASDVWGLGIVLYEAISGHVPYMASSYLPLARKICEDPLPPLEGEGLDDNLAAVVYRALNKRVGNRYPTATELAEDLEAWLAGSPTSASSQRPARTPTSVRRFVWVIPPVAAVVILLLVAVWGLGSPTGTSPTASPSPTLGTPAPTGQDPDWVRAGERRWRRVARLDEAQELMPAIEGWLARYQDHPLAGEAQALLRLSRRSVPSAVLQHSEGGHVRARYYGHVVVSWGEDGWVCRWDDGELTHRWRVGASIYALVVTPAGMVVTAGESQDLTVFPIDPRNKQALRRTSWTETRAAGICLALHPDGTSVAVGGSGPTVFRYAVGRGGVGARLAEYEDHVGEVHALAFDPGGTKLVTCCGNRADRAGLRPSMLRVYDEWGGEPLAERSMMWLGQAIEFFPDGQRFVLGDSAGQLEISDLEAQTLLRFAGKEVGVFVGGGMGAGNFAHSGGVRGATLARGASRLYSVSGALDHTDRNELRGWDAETGEELLSVRLRPQPYLSVDASPDGKTLIAGTTRGAIEVWKVE